MLKERLQRGKMKNVSVWPRHAINKLYLLGPMPREPRQHICNPRLQVLKCIKRESPEPSPVDPLEELPEVQNSVFASQGLDNLHRERNKPSQQNSTCYDITHGNSSVPVLSTPKITLSAEQTNILEIVKNGGNVFFTGPAGTSASVPSYNATHSIICRHRQIRAAEGHHQRTKACWEESCCHRNNWDCSIRNQGTNSSFLCGN